MRVFLDNVSVHFPIYDAKQRSLKTKVIAAATGGGIIEKPSSVTLVEALKDINIDLREGDRLALIGHNGSGKTTLLRVLAGAYLPTRGTASIEGRVTSLLDPTLGMDLDATGVENVRLRSLFLGVPKAALPRLMEDVIAFSELGQFLEMPVRTYSSGMVLRLAFSISTAFKPEILLMDEWLSVGDDAFRAKAETRLDEFVRSAGILVVATHDHGLAQRLGCRAVELKHGVMV